MKKKCLSICLSLALAVTATFVCPQNQTVAKAAVLDFADAVQVTFNTTYQGMVPAKTYEDSQYKYKLSVEDAGLLEIDAQGTPDYYIYDDNGDRLERIWVGDNAENDTKLYLNAGDYYVRIGGNDKDTDKYFSIVFTFASSKESFAEKNGVTNDEFSLANKIKLGTSYKGQFMSCGSDTNAIIDAYDYYVFDVPMKGQVNLTLNVRDLIGNGAPFYEIYDAQKNPIVNGHIWISEGSSATASCELEKGTYYLLVRNEIAVKYGFPGFAYDFKLDYKATAKTAVSTATQNGSKATVKFKKVPGAKKYIVYYSTSKSFSAKTTKQVTTTKTTVTLNKLNGTKTYYVKVKPVTVSDGKTYNGSASAKKAVKKPGGH